MTIEETPYTKITELEDNSVNGEGAYIPVIIGQTGNTVSADNLKIQTFERYEQACATPQNKGIGTDPTTNKSLAFLKPFLDECKPEKFDEIGLPKFYFIDMGNLPFTNGNAWADAFELAKTKIDAKVEIIVGFKKANAAENITSEEIATIVGILSSADTSIKNAAERGNIRQLYFTVEGATDADMRELTKTTNNVKIQSSRILPMEPGKFPEICARYCVTPYYVEPGFIKFRTVSLEDVTERTEADEKILQNAGINFIRREMVSEGEIARICAGVSSAKPIVNNPHHDELPHIRRNVDHLMERIHRKASDILKDNETSFAVDMLQTDVDDIVDDEIKLRRMQEGTEFTVSEAGTTPFKVKIKGKAKAVNAIYYVDIEYYIQAPQATA